MEEDSSTHREGTLSSEYSSLAAWKELSKKGHD